MKNATNRRATRLRLLSLLCLFAILLLSFSGCFSSKESEPEDTALPPATYESPWLTEKTVTKHMTGTNGRIYTATITQKNRISTPDPDRARDEEICLELCAAWMLSCIAMDYTLHFSLFPEQQLAEFEKEELSCIGFSLKEATLRIEEVVKEIYGLSDFRLDLSLVDISFYSAEESQDSEQFKKPNLKRYGMDTNAIESYAVCTFDRVKLSFHDVLHYEDFLSDWSSTITLYRYDGVWYLEPQRLDDDISIDLVQSEKGETQGYYKEEHIIGTVTAIHNGLLVIDNEFVSPLTDACKTLVVGDKINATYYSMGINIRGNTSITPFTWDVLVGVIVGIAPPTEAPPEVAVP